MGAGSNLAALGLLLSGLAGQQLISWLFGTSTWPSSMTTFGSLQYKYLFTVICEYFLMVWNTFKHFFAKIENKFYLAEIKTSNAVIVLRALGSPL